MDFEEIVTQTSKDKDDTWLAGWLAGASAFALPTADSQQQCRGVEWDGRIPKTESELCSQHICMCYTYFI